MKLIKLFLLMSCLCLATGCSEPAPENMLEGAEETQLAEIRAELEAQQKERASSTDRPQSP
ncbi:MULTISPECIES: secreted protein [Pirellulaceae]|uniref:Secreted protein n=1 Tax=Aporhodopirellula rubra TaxID=980271 RepID=A0A7W5E4A6_9BACT|nr:MULTISPECIES: secreted protein [Pirellulaceae]EMI40317.1 secreted protein [Rhodopirellula sp. SWK7]MBB3209880.1 hypothetical protein [Aporhodopirellula rubra]